MMKVGSVFLVSTMIVGLGIGQVMAATSGPGARSSTPSAGDHVNFSRGETPNGPPGVTGDNDWIRPDCLQASVPVQTARGVMYERAPYCPG